MSNSGPTVPWMLVFPVGRAERDAILEFVRARRPEVSDLRTRTYLAWLPVAAARIGGDFLAPNRDTPVRFSELFAPKEYAQGSRVTVAQCLATFWRWRLARDGPEFPSWLRIKFERWKPTNGASDILTREEVARLADQAQNFRDTAWIWTLFKSGNRPDQAVPAEGASGIRRGKNTA
ncbi:MAG: hypothetical protein LVQ64_01355 [Thermoplasmatales archaeon]|nr:hypothetical protein [Thermoplasmatales archaeon]